MTNQSTEQLALFMNARDVRDYGTAAWADLDLAGQEAYLTDAAAFVSAMKALGWTPPAELPEPQGEPSDAQALEDFLGKLAGDGAYALDFTSAESLHRHVVALLKRDIAALRAAGGEGR